MQIYERLAYRYFISLPINFLPDNIQIIELIRLIIETREWKLLNRSKRNRETTKTTCNPRRDSRPTDAVTSRAFYQSLGILLSGSDWLLKLC